MVAKKKVAVDAIKYCASSRIFAFIKLLSDVDIDLSTTFTSKWLGTDDKSKFTSKKFFLGKLTILMIGLLFQILFGIFPNQ